MNNMSMEFEEEAKTLSDYIAILRRRKRQLLLPAAITFAVILLVAIFWPPTYQSSATILIEAQEVPKDLVSSTVTSYANQQIQIITQRTMTLKNIMDLVEKYDLYDEAELKRTTRTDIAQKFRDEDVKLDIISAEVIDPRSGRPIEATIAFNLSYNHGNPLKAQKVASELVTLYLNENLRSRTEQSASASSFLEQEAAALAKKLEELESELAVFKENNEGSLPELYQYNLTIIDRTERELLENTLRLKELKKKKMQLESELAQISPYSATVLPSGESVLSDYDRLKSLESEYRRKSAVYSIDHPDVMRLVREIEVLKETLGGGLEAKDRAELLKAEQDRLSAFKDKYTAGHPKVVAQQRVVDDVLASTAAASQEGSSKNVADNPGYIFTQTQLRSTEIEMNILVDKTQELREKMARYESAILKMPMVEKEYAKLQRDYTNAQNKSVKIKLKLDEAKLGESLEQGRKGERFTLIQPPILPEQPVSPNRMAIIFVGLILAAGVGFGFVIIAEAMDQSIRGEKQLADVLGYAPLMSVPYIYLDEELEQKNKTLYSILGSVFGALLFGLLMIHLFFKPLDVIWFILLRKLGIG